MSTSWRSFIHLAPRVLVFLYAAFVSLFAFDVWEMEGSFWLRLGGFLIHLIPVYLIIAVGLIGWRRPLLGGIGCILLVLAMATFFGWWTESMVLLPMGVPLLITGALFIADDRLNGGDVRPSLGH